MHIHRGTAAAQGPPVVDLTGPWAKSNGSYVRSGTVLKLSSVMAPDGRTLMFVFGRIVRRPGRFYVNVHTQAFPEGAVRGQLYRA